MPTVHVEYYYDDDGIAHDLDLTMEDEDPETVKDAAITAVPRDARINHVRIDE